MGPAEAEQGGEGAGGELLDDGEGGGDGVDVGVGVEGGEEELGDEADGGGRGVELVEEALVPGVDAVGEDLADGGEEAVLAGAVGRGQQGGEVALEGGGRK